MSQPYPITRETREEAIALGSGVATYGPFGFKIFDVEDVEVWTRPASGGAWALASVTVAKTANLEFDTFSITFPAAITSATQYKVLGARTPERSAGVRKGTRLDPDALEKELSKIAATLQEIKRGLAGSVSVLFGDGLTIASDFENGRVLVKSGDALIEGPNAQDIAQAQGYAQAAAAAAQAAEDAAEAAALFDPATFYTRTASDARFEPRSNAAALSATYNAVAADNNTTKRFTASATMTIAALASLPADWSMRVVAAGGDVVVDPSGSEQINGASTFVVSNGSMALVFRIGGAFFAVGLMDGSIGNAKLASMAQATFKGRAVGAGAGAPTDLSVADMFTALNAVFPARPQTAAGPGQVVSWATPVSGGYAAPSQGTWLVIWAGYLQANASWAAGLSIAVAAGGAVVAPGSSGIIFTGVAWRIQ